MFSINLDELKSKIEPIIGNIDSIQPIGNHELKRHLVYKLLCGNQKYVIKLYFRKNRWNREVFCYKHFEDTEVLVPRIVDYGIFDNGTEWLIYEYIEGVLLNHVIEKLRVNSLKEIYFDIGRQLSIIHHHKRFDFFGSMNKKGESIKGFTTYRAYFEALTSRMLTSLHTFNHDNNLLIEQSEIQLKAMYNLLDNVDKANLCHNDFGTRNILVNDSNGKYHLKAIIDFERCVPSDRDKELIYFYLPLREKNIQLANSFRLGYEEYGYIHLDMLYKKKNFYNLYEGLEICSWAKEVAYDYYLKGIEILEDTMVNFR